MNNTTKIFLITLLLVGTAAYLYLSPDFTEEDLYIDLEDEEESDYC